MFGSDAWAHITDEKMKELQPKSEKCIFVEYAKGYIIFQLNSNEIIIRSDVKIDENVLAREPNSTFVSSLACEPSDGRSERHNTFLVAKGFSHVEGIDYNETFALIAKMKSICFVLALVASHK